MNKADNENLKSFHKDLKEVKSITIPANTLKVGDTINFEIKANLKADNLPMSAEEFFFEELKEDLYSTPQFMEMYANYLLSHHINVLAERKYSEEEVSEYAYYFESCYAKRPMQTPLTPCKWFEQFKKK